MKCPTCFAAFPKTSSLYEFCQTDKDCFSPVKQLLPFWWNYNNNKTWYVQNWLALFCSGTYVKAWVIIPDWECCNCFDFSVKTKWWRLFPNLYHAEDFILLSNMLFSAYGFQVVTSFIPVELVIVLCCFAFLSLLSLFILLNTWNQDVVFAFFLWRILGYTFSFANLGKPLTMCSELDKDYSVLPEYLGIV